MVVSREHPIILNEDKHNEKIEITRGDLVRLVNSIEYIRFRMDTDTGITLKDFKAIVNCRFKLMSNHLRNIAHPEDKQYI